MAISSTLASTLKEVMPFRDQATTLVCVTCLKLLTFPSDAPAIKCPNCQTMTKAFIVKCTACFKKCKIQLGGEAKDYQCSCGYAFTPLTKLFIRVPAAGSGGGEGGGDATDRTTKLFLTLPGNRTHEVVAVNHQPLRVAMEHWGRIPELQGGYTLIHGRTKGKMDTSKTPVVLGLRSGDTIEVKRAAVGASASTHDFVIAQFGGPTNCAMCKEFIWGIYHQGRKCSKCRTPVHHRCAEKCTSICEANLRQLCGIQDFDDEDDEGAAGGRWVWAVVVKDEDVETFNALSDEAVEPECDPTFMSSLGKLTNFTDDEIKDMWVKYDDDENGTLDRQEMTALLHDLLPQMATTATVGGNDAQQTAAAIDRLIYRMDINQDGLIQWEEFWHFFKAQQDSNFLKNFDSLQGASLDDLQSMWYNYDEDGSGVLEFDEIIKFLGDLMEMMKASQDPKKKIANVPQHCFESFLTPGASMTWDDFRQIIAPNAE